MMALQFKTIQPVAYYRKFFEHGVRPDGRGLWKVRSTSVNINSISTADGSALARIGNTSVICGIKAELAVPKPDEPKKGYIVPNVELSPLCSPHFRPGPPGEQAQVSSQLVDNIIRCSECVDFEDLCVKEGKIVWVLYCDILCLNYDGTIIDAALMALVAALKCLRLPEVVFDADSEQPKVELEKTHALPVHWIPVVSTFCIFDENVILMDPTDEEENLGSGILMVATLDDNKLCSMYKPGGKGIDEKNVEECIAHAQNRGKQVRRMITEAINAT